MYENASNKNDQDKIPNPGSDEAIKRGCTCPVLDNNHGYGITGGFGGTKENPVFWISGDCPLHNRVKR